MPRYKVAIPAFWVPWAIGSLQNAIGEEARSLVKHVAQAEGPVPETSWALAQDEWRSREFGRADTNRVAMRQLEEALDQLVDHESKRTRRRVVVEAEAHGIRIAMAGVLARASQTLVPNYGAALTDGHLPEVARMLTSLQPVMTRRRTATRRRSASRRPSA